MDRTVCWRRLDEPGLEICRIASRDDGMEAVSTLLHAGPIPCVLRYRWRLDPSWRTRSLEIEVDDPAAALRIERNGSNGWRLDGVPQPRLDGCVEPDLSATPFCNGLAIRRLGRPGEMLALYVQAPELTVTPSLQRYEREGARWKYIDLGVAKGFEAWLDLDADGLIRRYEGLFEAL